MPCGSACGCSRRSWPWPSGAGRRAGRRRGLVREFAAHRPDVRVRIVREHQGDAIAAVRAGRTDLVLCWDRMPYGPPVGTAIVDGVEVAALVRRDHPEAHRTAMPREVFGSYPFTFFGRPSAVPA